MGKCKYCGAEAGTFKSAHDKCKSRDTGKRRIESLVCEAVGVNFNNMEDQIELIARGHYFGVDEVPNLKLLGWEAAILDANTNDKFDENTFHRLALLAIDLSLPIVEFQTNCIWKRYLTSLPFDHALVAKNKRIRKLAIAKAIKQSKRAVAEVKLNKQLERREALHKRRLQQQQEAERQCKLQQQEAAEGQRKLLEQELERERKYQEQEAERERKLQEEIAGRQRKLREEAERQKNVREEAERQCKQKEEEARKSREQREETVRQLKLRAQEKRRKIREIKSQVISDVKCGRKPNPNLPQVGTPFNFQKSENLAWVFDNTKYQAERVKKRRTHGPFGVSPTVYGMETVGTGTLALTTKHIYFASSQEKFRIRYNRIVAFKKFTDGIATVGIEISQDSANVRTQRFITGDGRFTYDLFQALARRY